MKKEILVVSDNFNEYLKYRNILETKFYVSIRTDFDETRLFLEKKKDFIHLVIFDIDDSLNNGLEKYIDLISYFNLNYLIIVDSNNDFLTNPNILEDNIISRTSVYPNLINI